MKNIANLILLIILANNVSGQKNDLGIYYNNSVPVHSVINGMGLLNFSTIGIDYYRQLNNRFSIGIGGQYQTRKNKWSIGEYAGPNGVSFSFTDKLNTLNIDLLTKYVVLKTQNKFNIYGQIGLTNQFHFTENVPLLIFKDLKITEQTIAKKISGRSFTYLGIGLKYSFTERLSIEPNLFGKLFLNPKNEVIFSNTFSSITATSKGSGFRTSNTGNQYGFNIKIGYNF